MFPLNLLEYANNVRPTKVIISGITPENITATTAGGLSFSAPTDGSGTCEIYLDGVFIDTTEVLISRNDLPDGFEITKGTNNYAKAALRSFPTVTLAFDKECSATWTLIKKVPKSDQLPGGKPESLSHLSQSTLKRLGLQVDDKSLHRVCELVHLQLGHPCPRRTYQSLKYYGINIPMATVQHVIDSCSTCKDKPHNNKPIDHQDSDRTGLVEHDLTQFHVEGIGKERWISTIYDMQHRFIDALPLRNKSEASLHTSQFLSKFKHVRRWRVDNAPELTGDTMKKVLIKYGVCLETTAPASSWSNGGVERANQTLKRLISTLMVHTAVDTWGELWPWFVNSACHAHNHTYNESIDKTPHASITGEPTTMDSLFPTMPFGQGVHFTNTTDGKKRKSITNRIPGIFLTLTHSGSAEILEPVVSESAISRHIVHPRAVFAASEEVTKETLERLRHISTQPSNNPTNTSEKPRKIRLVRTTIATDTNSNTEWVCTSPPYDYRAFACSSQQPTQLLSLIHI